MKTYVKPDAALVDVRLEERLATGQCPDDYDPSLDPDGYTVEPGTPNEYTPGCKGTVYGTTPS